MAVSLFGKGVSISLTKGCKSGGVPILDLSKEMTFLVLETNLDVCEIVIEFFFFFFFFFVGWLKGVGLFWF